MMNATPAQTVSFDILALARILAMSPSPVCFSKQRMYSLTYGIARSPRIMTVMSSPPSTIGRIGMKFLPVSIFRDLNASLADWAVELSRRREKSLKFSWSWPTLRTTCPSELPSACMTAIQSFCLHISETSNGTRS